MIVHAILLKYKDGPYRDMVRSSTRIELSSPCPARIEVFPHAKYRLVRSEDVCHSDKFAGLAVYLAGW